MIVAAPPKPPRKPTGDPQALFAEARRHRRQRRLRLAGLVLLLLALGGGAYGVVNSDGAGSGSGGGDRLAAGGTRTIVLLVDVSGSMRADDVKPSRLDAAVKAMTALVSRLPRSVEVGVVSFSTSATVVQAPTRDRARVREALRTLRPEAGTALGAGLVAAVDTTVATLRRDGIQRKAGRFLPAAIVLESDGAQNRGAATPLEAAQTAKRAGIRVYAVSLGTATGSVGYGSGRFANRIPVPPDPRIVKTIASVSHGQAFTAQTARRLAQIYERLASKLAR
jgi:Ca-activated chloride channel homolog